MQSQTPVNGDLNRLSFAFNGIIGAVGQANAVIANRLLTPPVLHSIVDFQMHASLLIEALWHQLPLLTQEALRIVYIDFFRLFVGYGSLWCANRCYTAYEPMLPITVSYFFSGILIFFQYTLWLMAWLQKPQSWIHSSILLLKLPEEWQRMPKTAALQLDVSCCCSCNKLREIKGDIRSTILYCFQQVVLSGMRLLPLGSVLTFVPHVLMTGRMLAEYRYRTEGVCDHHIERTYQQHWEFFGVLGLCHLIGVFAANSFFSYLINMPADAVEPCMSGLMMLAIVHLTYGAKHFPQPMEQSLRSFPIPDPTRFVVRSGIDFLGLRLKQNLQEPRSALALIEQSQQYVVHLQTFFLWLKLQYQNKIQSNCFFSNLSLQCVLPTFFYGSKSFLQDPVIGPFCLNQINQWRRALIALLYYRQLMLQMSKILKPLEPIQKARESLVVRIPLFFFGGVLSVFNTVFTLDFVINQCPKFLQDIRTMIAAINKHKLIREKLCSKILDKLQKLETNINAVKKILNELPESSRAEFFQLLKDEQFEIYLKSIAKYLHAMLALHEYEFAVIETSDIETVDSCEFPDEWDLEHPDAVPSLPRDASLNEWDDSDRRLEDRASSTQLKPPPESKPSAQPALPIHSDDEWDDSDYRLERRM